MFGDIFVPDHVCSLFSRSQSLCVFDKKGLIDCSLLHKEGINLTHLSLVPLLWDIGKQYSPRCDDAEQGVPSGAILFAHRNFIAK